MTSEIAKNMICPKCRAFQPKNNVCQKCGIVIEKVDQPQKMQNEEKVYVKSGNYRKSGIRAHRETKKSKLTFIIPLILGVILAITSTIYQTYSGMSLSRAEAGSYYQYDEARKYGEKSDTAMHIALVFFIFSAFMYRRYKK